MKHTISYTYWKNIRLTYPIAFNKMLKWLEIDDPKNTDKYYLNHFPYLTKEQAIWSIFLTNFVYGCEGPQNTRLNNVLYFFDEQEIYINIIPVIEKNLLKAALHNIIAFVKNKRNIFTKMPVFSYLLNTSRFRLNEIASETKELNSNRYTATLSAIECAFHQLEQSYLKYK